MTRAASVVSAIALLLWTGMAHGQVNEPKPYASEGWTQQVAARLQQFRRYPTGATNDKYAKATVSFTVRRDGNLSAATIKETSGYLEKVSTGYHSWTPDEVRRFEKRHPVGTKARLAFALLLYTGQRRSDVTRLGLQHLRNGRLTFTQFKGRNRKNPTELTLPIISALQRVIDASPCGESTFLVNDFGQPFTDAGFGNKFRQWCNEAGLKNCSAHGLRKAGAATAAVNGATTKQLMAIFGWSSSKMADYYTRAADQKKLAESAMDLLTAGEQSAS